ncbi:hypothetical protein [Nonomuraea wenchangensis]|uniref:Uncharacterized protein n=1 Tax=Nonomuraea wenchangensis TaxID=568860 RepID=A0A1I0KBT1_9ACTN|nr:hypothetical protein [Nonomuraea wenchangensis]SEU21832.1 hypothetical protein SAMN05421811_107420 [Nonomuraea wenchangensis]
MSAGPVGERTFRANPRYELVPAEQPPEEDDGDFYGVLRPRGDCGLAVRSCSPETALLFLTLAEPGRVPVFARRALAEDGGRALARLVADGVLEVLTDEGFRYGYAAADAVLPGRSRGGQGRIAALSVAALRYGQALADLPAEALAGRLYGYGHQPVSAELLHRLPDEAAVDAYLGGAPGGLGERARTGGWTETTGDLAGPSPWRHWSVEAGRRGWGRSGVTYKLYVSPSAEAMPAALAEITGGLARTPGVTGFKTAREAAGICRPDKIVIYFDRLDDLREGASLLAGRVGGMAAHGVAFSAAVTLDGLVSWGADPPRAGAQATSWRMWVAGRLAEHLVTARTAHSGMPPWRFALERLRLSGVDTDTWVPTDGMWSEAAREGHG